MTDQLVDERSETERADRADRLARLASRRGGRVPNPAPVRLPGAPTTGDDAPTPAREVTPEPTGRSPWAAPTTSATRTETRPLQPVPGGGRRRRRPAPAAAAKIVTAGLSTTALLGMMAAFGIADRRDAQQVDATAGVADTAATAPGPAPIDTVPVTSPPTTPAPSIAPSAAPSVAPATDAVPGPVPVPVPVPVAVDLAVPAPPPPPAPQAAPAPAPAPQAESSGS